MVKSLVMYGEMYVYNVVTNTSRLNSCTLTVNKLVCCEDISLLH